MGTYAVRLRIRTDQPLTRSRLDQLGGGRHEIAATGNPRSLSLDVRLTVAAGDVVGALARSLNIVLDVVPGVVRRAEVVAEASSTHI